MTDLQKQQLSLRASGIIDGTNFFIKPTKCCLTGLNNTTKDVRDVLTGIWEKVNRDSKYLNVYEMLDECKNVYLTFNSSTFQPDSKCEFVTLRLNLFDKSRNEMGRTYLDLHNIEIAKVEMIGNKIIKKINVISKDELKKKLPSYIDSSVDGTFLMGINLTV